MFKAALRLSSFNQFSLKTNLFNGNFYLYLKPCGLNPSSFDVRFSFDENPFLSGSQSSFQIVHNSNKNPVEINHESHELAFTTNPLP